MIKIREALNEGTKTILNMGVENGEREAAELLSFVTGIGIEELRRKGETNLTNKEEARFYEVLNKRSSGYPLQYILGEWSFYNLDRLIVGEGVLIPRPETELLVDEALEILNGKKEEKPEVVDLCSGSGCIAIAVALNAPWCHVTAVEYSDKAFYYLNENAKNYNLPNLTLKKGNLFNGPEGDIDLLLSNPPYIKTEDIKGLQAEVQYEPEMALNGGEDGLMFNRGIRDKWFKKINPGGTAIMEIGEDQGQDVYNLFKTVADNITIKQDYSRLDRLILAFKLA